MKKFLLAVLCATCLLSGRRAWAEMSMNNDAQIQALRSEVMELAKMVNGLKLIVDDQKRELNSLRVSAGPRPMARFTPEIGAVADVALRSDSPRVDTGGADRVSVREIELMLGSNVDPFSRFDATVAFNEESTAELEEAYLTRFSLPLDTTARIGRFKPRLGKDLAMHRDSLDTADEPLVIQRYFGEEGMSKSGVDLTKFLDLPTPMTHQLTLGVLEGGNGEGGTAFGETKRRPTVYGRLKNYVDLSDMTNLEVGLSDALGSRDDDMRMEVNVLALDATLIHHLDPQQTLKLQSEWFNVNRRESFRELTDDTTGAITFQDVDGNVWGGYGLIDFRINSQWALGARFDRVGLIDNPIENTDNADTGYTGYLTFYQSEFARWRLQFNHLELANQNEDNQVFIQGTFAIGDHKHKIQ